MKRDLITSILALVLLASSLATAATGYKLVKLAHQQRLLQEDVVRVNQSRALLRNFAIDLNEYSERNPAVIPLLDHIGLRMHAVTNTIPLR